MGNGKPEKITYLISLLSKFNKKTKLNKQLQMGDMVDTKRQLTNKKTS